MTVQDTATLGGSTTASLAAKALGCSRKTVTRMMGDGRLERTGASPDGEALVSLTSVVAQQASRRSEPIHEPPVAAPDPVIAALLATLTDELQARRHEALHEREQLMIAQQSMSTLEAERDRLRRERDSAVQALQDMSRGGPLSRWRKRRDSAALLAGLGGTLSTD